MADSGENSDGFSTIVQPAAMAGITFSAIWFIGQFQGVMRAQTPMNSVQDLVVGRIGSQVALELETFQRIDEGLDMGRTSRCL